MWKDEFFPGRAHLMPLIARHPRSQGDPGVDLDAGRTLTKTISNATATLVASSLTRRQACPSRGSGGEKRCRCSPHTMSRRALIHAFLVHNRSLFEIGFTPKDKLLVLTHGFNEPARGHLLLPHAPRFCGARIVAGF